MSAATTARIGGLLLRVEGVLWFVPASVALAVAPFPPVARVPGAPQELVGVALHEGDVVPVLRLGDARSTLVVCNHRGEKVGLTGGEVVGTGLYPADPGGNGVVGPNEERALALDLGAIYARVQGQGWAGRWRG